MPDFINILAPIAVLAGAVAVTSLEASIRQRSWKPALQSAGALCIAGGLLLASATPIAFPFITAGTVFYGVGGILKPDHRYTSKVIARAVPGVLIVPGGLLLLPLPEIAFGALAAVAGLYCYAECRLRVSRAVEAAVFLTMSVVAALGLAALIYFKQELSLLLITVAIVDALLVTRLAVWAALYRQRSLFRKVRQSIEALREGRAPELPEKSGDPGLHSLSDAVFTLIRAIQGYQGDLHNQLQALEDREKTRREILQNTSHELRTPLMGVIGNAELLLNSRKHPLNENQAKFAQTIMEQARNLLRIINDILTYAQVEEGHGVKLITRRANLGELVREVAGEYKSLADNKNIVIEVDACDVQAETDTNQLARATRHLLSNAVKFNRKGGRVKVKLESADSTAFLTVEDNGMGIPHQQVEKLFEGFRQGEGEANRREGGLGLGLALVKSVTEAHGGEVKVESTPGEGSRFTLSIPRVVAAGSEPEMPEAVGDKLVLVYDPSKVVYELVREHLYDTTVDVGGMFKPEHFHKLLKNYNPRAIILADQNEQLGESPEKGKPVLLKQLAGEADARRVPVLIVSSEGGETRSNGHERLAMPFSREQLVSALKKCFRKSSPNTQSPKRTVANGGAG